MIFCSLSCPPASPVPNSSVPPTDPNDKIVALEANKYMQEYVVVTKKMNNKYEMHFYDRKLNKIEDKVITLDKLNGNEFHIYYSFF